MLKATLRGAVLLGLLAWSLPSFAEVQNVRVGGDVTVRAFHRGCMDLNCGDDNGGSTAAPTNVQDRHDDFFMQTTAVNVAADLTENVSTFVRVTNERDWDGTAANGTENVTDIDLSQAYVTLKELFYSPLTLRVGSQPIMWGRGFVLGSALLPSVAKNGNDRNAAITANEFTDFTAFDAIRATLDLSSFTGSLPLSLDTVYIKLDENTTGLADDVNLIGFNLSSRFEDTKSEAELYFLNKSDRNVSAQNAFAALATANNDNKGSVNTLGIRGSAQPVDGAHVFGELAYQFGQRGVDVDGVLIAGDSQQAWATDLGVEYSLSGVAASPKLGFEWIFWSGKDVNGAVSGWDPIARGYYTTALREFQTGANTGFYPTPQAGDTAGATNQHQLALYGSVNPIEDLSIAPRFTLFVLDKGAIPVAGSKRKHYAGFEWDTMVTYNYTEDVQLGFLYGLFAPGNVYRHPNDSLAQELVTTVGVKF
ncbi:MAG: alginate export family protein [Candidatus Omnitrophica bacterium]|nr:alginate export family protein [Candidatus Omnitrophota bacterium]